MELGLDDEEEEDDDTDCFDMNALLEALPAPGGGVFDLGAITEALTETEGVEVPPTDRRDPRERYTERPDGR